MTLQRQFFLIWLTGSACWLALTFGLAFFTTHGLTRDVLVIMAAPPLVVLILGPALAWAFRLRKRP